MTPIAFTEIIFFFLFNLSQVVDFVVVMWDSVSPVILTSEKYRYGVCCVNLISLIVCDLTSFTVHNIYVHWKLV